MTPQEKQKFLERYELAINSISDGLWDWDLLNNEVYFSPSWKQMLGFSDDELPNALEEWANRVHPDDKQQAIDDIMQNQNGLSKQYVNVHRLKHKNGSWVWILDRGHTIFDDNHKAIRMIGFHTDITKEKESEILLEFYNKRASKLLEISKLIEQLEEKDFLQECLGVIEELTKSSISFLHFIHANEQEIELVTWSKQTLEKYCDAVSENHYPVESAGIWANALRRKMPVIVNDYNSVELKRGLPPGHASLERFVSVPVLENEKVIMITGIGNKEEDYDALDVETLQLFSNDIWRHIQKKRLNQKLLENNRLLINQSRHAAMGEMISMIAHQWRQPLSSIAMSANNTLIDIKMDEIDPVALEQRTDEILQDVQYLSNTIDDFRNFFKPDKEVQKASMRDILDDSLKIIGKSIQNNNITLEIQSCEKDTIETYIRELMQVCINILNNAKEALLHSPLEQKKILVMCKNYENRIKISFFNNGKRISEDILDKIFEPYFSTKDEKTGTGLGLYLAKTIVEKHLQGTIIASNLENGVVFEITLPKRFGMWDRRE